MSCACADGDFNYSKQLLESGFGPNVHKSRERTGLSLAAARGNGDTCQLLHKFALHLCGHVDTIQFLASNGLKIDISERESAMESHSLLHPKFQQGEGVLSSFQTTWQEFVGDLSFWRALLLIFVIVCCLLALAPPFMENQPELVH
uniref:Uncharacterized protein n=1 Tax=Chinchilla lanigera TaxID=34839 RepID=A0A8C2UXS4_CHILA